MRYRNEWYEQIAKEIESGLTILDVGCGIGKLYEFVDHDMYKGIDITQEFLDVARERHPGISVGIGNILNISYRNYLYDVVVCRAVLEHLNYYDVETAIRELVRVAKHRVIISFFKKPGKRTGTRKNKGGWWSNRYAESIINEWFFETGRVEGYIIKDYDSMSSVWIVDLIEA